MLELRNIDGCELENDYFEKQKKKKTKACRSDSNMLATSLWSDCGVFMAAACTPAN